MNYNSPDCPICGKPMKLRKGSFGEFYGCSSYPECKATVSLGDVDEKFGQATYVHDGEDYGVCGRCGTKDTLSDMGFCSYCQHMFDKN